MFTRLTVYLASAPLFVAAGAVPLPLLTCAVGDAGGLSGADVVTVVAVVVAIEAGAAAESSDPPE